MKLKPLHEQTFVITGASSGIGLATAKLAAKAGAKLVLASRNDEALANLEKQINDEGGEAIHVVADVARRDEVERIPGSTMRASTSSANWNRSARKTTAA